MYCPKRIHKSTATLLLAVIATGYLASGNTAIQAGERPNIIIIYTDDHGFADLSCQGVFEDVKTPHTDRLAADGVRFTSGYCTAPQCRPSRAGLMTGRYQNRFGLEENGDNALPWSELTVAERLADAGYVTGMCGKWHLQGTVGSNGELPDGTPGDRVSKQDGMPKTLGVKDPGQVGNHGFQEYLSGPMNTFVATHSASGEDLGGTVVHRDRRFRLVVQAEWAASFIKRHARGEKPFFLYVPFFAPHVPLEAPEKYLARFPGEMPRRRRLALAMISAVDDGVGLIAQTLADHAVEKNTLVFYIADNGAPLKIHKIDAPGGGAGWDGSLNDPWIGEKGMLTEGGIRVPFIAKWPDRIPADKVYTRPAIAIDATATALVAGGCELDDRIDGVDLVPYLSGQAAGDPHEALYWRWAGQAAIREGDWKYLQGGGRRYLFNVTTEEQETENLIDARPELAARLREKLEQWADELIDPGLSDPLSLAGSRYFDHYLDGKTVGPSSRESAARAVSPPKAPTRTPEVLFKVRDVDEDGFVTLEEYIGNPAIRNVPVLTKRFHDLDTDGDARLTLEEMQRK